MGFLDKAKGAADKAKGAAEKAVDKSGDKFGDAIEKGIDFADRKTKQKHTDKLEVAGDKLKDTLDGLDGKNDDIPDKRKRTR
jgi:uncharacterized protein YjbJ (UPF0337 family)